jgi:hypothetical protein
MPPEESPVEPLAVWPVVPSADPDPELALSVVSSAEWAMSSELSIISAVIQTRKARDSNALRTV